MCTVVGDALYDISQAQFELQLCINTPLLPLRVLLDTALQTHFANPHAILKR